jgi:transcriptional regulator with XRE-family HTH domain
MAITIKNLLFEKYMDFQRTSGGRKSLKQFAEYIGVGEVYLNRLMNERRNAGEKAIVKLANFFSDLRFYDAAGMDRPDPQLVELRRAWGRLPDEEKKRIAEIAAPYIGRNDVPPTEGKAR